jgi:hypothetical protein
VQLRTLAGATLVTAAVLAVTVGGGTAATSVSPPSNTTQPSISGTTREGEVLTADPGKWTNSPTSYSYQWQRCDANGSNCTSIVGATARRYTLTHDDVNHHMRITVTAHNSAGTGSAISAQSSLVTAAGTGPTNTSLPSISGSAQEGLTLSADKGQWNGQNPISYAYQWQRCDMSGANCTDVAGATGQSYTLGVADVAHTMRVRVTASNSRGSHSATSAQTALIAPSKSGGAAISVATIALPDRLIVDRVQFTPNPLQSRRAFTARFHVTDSRGFAIQGALVYALGLPYAWLANAPEIQTDGSGWATITMRPTSAMPLTRGGALVIFVRARKPGEDLLAGVSTRRLVQVGIR